MHIFFIEEEAIFDFSNENDGLFGSKHLADKWARSTSTLCASRRSRHNRAYILFQIDYVLIDGSGQNQNYELLPIRTQCFQAKKQVSSIVVFIRYNFKVK